jgi:hypothetical protein
MPSRTNRPRTPKQTNIYLLSKNMLPKHTPPTLRTSYCTAAHPSRQTIRPANNLTLEYLLVVVLGIDTDQLRNRRTQVRVFILIPHGSLVPVQSLRISWKHNVHSTRARPRHSLGCATVENLCVGGSLDVRVPPVLVEPQCSKGTISILLLALAW